MKNLKWLLVLPVLIFIYAVYKSENKRLDNLPKTTIATPKKKTTTIEKPTTKENTS